MIKFRVYDTAEKNYVTNKTSWCITSDGRLTVVGDNLPRNDFIVEYDTGLCDKDGTKIYDGDIVKEGVVKNYFGSWYIEPTDHDYATPMNRYNYEYEIVDNIHNYRKEN